MLLSRYLGNSTPTNSNAPVVPAVPGNGAILSAVLGMLLKIQDFDMVCAPLYAYIQVVLGMCFDPVTYSAVVTQYSMDT